jgi:hypothetical protein
MFRLRPYERTVLAVPDSNQLMDWPPVEISDGSIPFGASCHIIAGLRAKSAMFTPVIGSLPNTFLFKE